MWLRRSRAATATGSVDGDLRLRQVVDVIVLAHDEALPFAIGVHVDAAVDLENDRPALERQIGVRVRHLDDCCRPVRPQVQELAAVTAESDVPHDVTLLPCLVERPFEAIVEVRRHDQLVRLAVRPQETGDPGERAVDRARSGLPGVEGMQLVVERPHAARQRHVFGDVREVSGVLRRTVEGLDEVGDDLRRDRVSRQPSSRRSLRPRQR